MKAFKLISFGIFTFILISSCSPRLSPFTERLYEKNDFTEKELKQIQFYLSEDIVMRRELKGNKAEIVSGEIKTIDGKKIEEIIIKKGTPGLLVFEPKEKRFAVSFENESDKSFLMFGPNKKYGGRFVLLASEWRKNGGIVTYNDIKYRIDANDAFAGLLVNLKETQKVIVNKHVAKGRKIN